MDDKALDSFDTLNEMLSVMLAPEPSAGQSIYKARIKEIAIPYARRALRAEGKTFVVSTNGINPLVVKIQPVVDALNAPYMNGLEIALRNLGLTVQDYDRTALKEYVEKIQPEIFNGDKIPTAGELDKLVVALGVEEYNKFIKVYNQGGN